MVSMVLLLERVLEPLIEDIRNVQPMTRLPEAERRSAGVLQ